MHVQVSSCALAVRRDPPRANVSPHRTWMAKSSNGGNELLRAHAESDARSSARSRGANGSQLGDKWYHAGCFGAQATARAASRSSPTTLPPLPSPPAANSAVGGSTDTTESPQHERRPG